MYTSQSNETVVVILGEWIFSDWYLFIWIENGGSFCSSAISNVSVEKGSLMVDPKKDRIYGNTIPSVSKIRNFQNNFWSEWSLFSSLQNSPMAADLTQILMVWRSFHVESLDLYYTGLTTAFTSAKKLPPLMPKWIIPSFSSSVYSHTPKFLFLPTSYL